MYLANTLGESAAAVNNLASRSGTLCGQQLTSMSAPAATESASDRTIRIILEHAARIGREQNLDELIRLNADFARDLSGADRCSIWLIDEKSGQLWTRVAHGQSAIRISIGEGLVGACISQDEVIIVNHLEQESRLLRRVDLGSGYHTEQVLCVPLRTEGQVIGAIQLLNKDSGFKNVDAELIVLIAQFAASAIESERLRQGREEARLLRRELDLALEVQARLLPPSGEPVGGLEFAGFCRPAKTVGGDYYDAIPFQDGSCAFTLGDVSGKGVPAALMMASIQSLLRTLIQRGPTDLAGAIGELNRSVHASSTADRYSTLFCGFVTADHSRLIYVNAGHVPPLLWRSSQELTSLSHAGLPVGMLPSWTYTQHTLDVEPGDLLLIVSDGVTEACNPNGEFWESERLEQFLRDFSATTQFQDISTVLCRKLDDWASGAEQQDDITVVLLKIGPAVNNVTS